ESARQGLVRGRAEETDGQASFIGDAATELNTEAVSLAKEVGVFLDAIQGVGEDLDDQTFASISVNVDAKVTFDGGASKNVRVTEISCSHMTIDCPLNQPAGTHTSLAIDGITRALDARIALVEDGKTRLQLPLNHEHIAYMREQLAGMRHSTAA
ncbi:MAG: hypothetical protein OXT01_20005, partial [Rhodospirillaceae bacterium]|nr:hypothetical protein [Rhodospirillaceae bacterium]